MTATENVATPQRTAPYVSFGALRKLLDRMADEHGAPGRVDRSYLPGMSGGYQSQLLSSLRSLGLIDTDGTPSTDLKTIVSDLDTEFPAFMQRTVEMLYPEAVALARSNGSQGQLEESFRSVFGFSGSTLESAIRFYLDASQFAGMPVSAHFRAPARPKPRRRAAPSKTKASKPADGDTADSPEQPRLGAMPSSTQRVELSSGGSLVVTMTVDLFSLTDADRTFVFDIVDKMKSYKDVAQPPKDLASDPSSQGGDAG